MNHLTDFILLDIEVTSNFSAILSTVLNILHMKYDIVSSQIHTQREREKFFFCCCSCSGFYDCPVYMALDFCLGCFRENNSNPDMGLVPMTSSKLVFGNSIWIRGRNVT